MKKELRTFSIKTLILALVVCLGVSMATAFASENVVLAEEEAVFALTEGASIRDGSKETDGNYGLRFETKVTTAWFEDALNASESYNFGTLIFPTSKLGKFSELKSVDENKEDTEAVKFLAKTNVTEKVGFTYNSSIVYNEQIVAGYMKNVWSEKYAETEPSKEEIKTVMRKLYAMDLTAVSYVETDSGVKYTGSYTTSMIKVAARLQSNEDWAEKAKAYLGDGKVATLNTYADDDDNVVANFDAQNVSLLVIGNETLVEGEDYTINDGAITLNASDVSAKKGTYEDIYAFDSENNLTIINVLYATDVLKTADDVKNALDYGKYDLKYMEENYATLEDFKPHDGVYVLANDVDMTGYTFYNNYDNSSYATAIYKMQNIGFYGIFDGLGHTISNATVEVKNYYAGNVTEAAYPTLKAAGFGAWQNHRGKGIFHDIKAGSAIRNVAFVNLTAIGQADNNASTPIGGILARSILGTIENVYIDINPASKDTENIKGLFYDTNYTSTIKNVVINWPMNDWVFDYTTLTTSSSFHYGTGSLATLLNKTNAVYENIYVTSPKPLSYEGDANSTTGELESLTNDFFVYGANENELFYNHAVNGEGKTFSELAVDYKQAGKVRVFSAAVRYDSVEDAAKSTDETTLAMRENLVSTGYFKVINGQVLWHDMKVQETISSAIDYNAATGELVTNELDDEEILSVTIGDQVLTQANGGLIKENGAYLLNAKQSATDESVGVPFIDNTTLTPDQVMTLTVETKDVVYTLDNVSYWTALIGSASDFKAFIEFDPGTSWASNLFNKGLYKLSSDIDFENEDGSLVTMDYYNRSTGNTVYQSGQNGFAGVFDGDGYTIKNFASKVYGLFSSLTSYQISGNKVVVKDFAMTNVRTSYKFDGSTVTYGSVLAYAMHWNNSVNVEVSNIYVQIDPSSHMAYGLIAIPSAQLKMNNVYVEYEKSRIVAPSKYAFDGDYSEADGNTYIAIDSNVDNGSLCQSTTLFKSLRRIETSVDANVTNVYIASPQPVAWQGTNAGSYFNGYWKHDTTNKTHTLLNNGYSQGNTGTSGFYYGFASNEVKSYIPVIKEMKPAFAEISVMDDYIGNTVKTGFFCSKCNEPIATGTKGDACSMTADCDGTLVGTAYYGFWGDARSYVWTFHDIGAGYVNKAISETNGVWKFTGVKKFDTPSLMAQAGNDYTSFTGTDGNGLWAASNGALTWVGNNN